MFQLIQYTHIVIRLQKLLIDTRLEVETESRDQGEAAEEKQAGVTGMRCEEADVS